MFIWTLNSSTFMRYSFLHLCHFQSSSYVKENDIKYELKVTSWPEDIVGTWDVGFRLQSHNSLTHINMITDEHKALIHAYQKEPLLKQDMDALTKKSSFTDRWSLLGARFPDLIDYCGTVAPLFPWKNTVKFVFYFLSYVRRKTCSIMHYIISA